MKIGPFQFNIPGQDISKVSASAAAKGNFDLSLNGRDTEPLARIGEGGFVSYNKNLKALFDAKVVNQPSHPQTGPQSGPIVEIGDSPKPLSIATAQASRVGEISPPNSGKVLKTGSDDFALKLLDAINQAGSRVDNISIENPRRAA